MDFARNLELAIQGAIEEGQIPGAVVLVGKGNRVLYQGAFGQRQIVPEPRPMELDTVFDLASVSKPIATAAAVMQLVESGKIVLNDPVRRFLPGFDSEGRENIAIRHLLTHTSGLPPYRNYLHDFGEDMPREERRTAVIADLSQIALQTPPGEAFCYSCLGYIVLTSVVETVSGQPLKEYVQEHLFGPLGLEDTCFCPSPELVARCAATEQYPEGVLCGVVHDENARFLNGVGGNAGLFSTAQDLSRYVSALLDRLESRGGRSGRFPLSPATLRAMMTPQTRIEDGIRGLGWDIDTGYTPQMRGEIFPAGGVGHTGYTGTSVWIDPPRSGYVILLTNRVHLGRDRDVSRLRRQVANIAAAWISEYR
jgi:CubicO group peptidase (beta-lactamase class C family)